MNFNARALALLLVGALACRSGGQGSSGTSSVANTSRAGNEDTASTSAPRPASSLGTKDFLDRGVPSPDRAWSAKDYSAATGALRGLKPDAYPLRGDPKSGPVFARFVADDNLAFSRNAKMPLDTRLPEAVEALGASRSLAGVYLEAFQKGAPLGPETLALFQYLFSEADAVLDLADAFILTLDPTDPKYAVRMQGAAKVVSGIGEMARGAVMTLAEKTAYSLADLRSFAEGLRSSMPKLVARLDAEHRQEILDELTSARDAETDPGLKASIGELLRVVQAEPSKPLAPGAATAEPH
jgi:hypothetical protein